MKMRGVMIGAVLCAGLVGLSWFRLPADEADGKKTAAAAAAGVDIQVFLDGAAAFAEAYNAGSAEAVSALFGEQAEFVDGSGNVFQGRDAIAAEFAAYFQLQPNATIDIAVDDVRLITPSVAIEEGTSTITSADGTTSVSQYTVVHVQREERWLMGSVRVLEDVPDSPHSRLMALAWLIGEWVDEAPDSVIGTDTRWSPDGNYILADYTVIVEGRGTVQGQQRIGWDPLTKLFKSWVFDSEGGYGEGMWTNVGSEWVVKATGVLPDGRTASATNIFTPLNDDSFGMRSVDRVVGGEVSPDIAVTVVRKPPQPAQYLRAENDREGE